MRLLETTKLSLLIASIVLCLIGVFFVFDHAYFTSAIFFLAGVLCLGRYAQENKS